MGDERETKRGDWRKTGAWLQLRRREEKCFKHLDVTCSLIQGSGNAATQRVSVLCQQSGSAERGLKEVIRVGCSLPPSSAHRSHCPSFFPFAVCCRGRKAALLVLSLWKLSSFIFFAAASTSPRDGSTSFMVIKIHVVAIPSE